MTGPVLSKHNDHSTWSIINKTPRKKKILPSFNYKSKWASIKILGMQNSTKFKHNFILSQNQMGRFVRYIEREILLEYKSKRHKRRELLT